MGVQASSLPGQGRAGANPWRATDRSAKDRSAKDWRPQFRLRPGQDDALIQWLASLAPRQRSEAIREALYQHLAAREERDRGEGWTEDPELGAALDALF